MSTNRLISLATCTMATAICLLAPSSGLASGNTLQVAVETATPEQGIPATISFSGEVQALSSEGAGPRLRTVVRPAGGIACQATYENDQAAAGHVSRDLVSKEVGPGSFQASDTYDPPDTGPYLICAWLEDSRSVAVAGPATATFTTRAPQVAQLTVGLASPAQPGVGFQVNYTTQTDQQLTLNSVIKPSGGLPCASSYELDRQQNQSEQIVFIFGSNVFGGPTTTSGTITEQAAGPYLVCAWIEGPNDGEVVAASTTNIYVGTPPPPPRPQPIPERHTAKTRACTSAQAREARLLHEYDSLRQRALKAHGHRRSLLSRAAGKLEREWRRARLHRRSACMPPRRGR